MGAVCGKPDDADGAGPDRAGFKSSATKAELRWLEIPRQPRGRRWRGEPSAPSASAAAHLPGRTPRAEWARARVRWTGATGASATVRAPARRTSGPHPSPGTLGGVPAPFAHVADSRSSAGGGRAGVGLRRRAHAAAAASSPRRRRYTVCARACARRRGDWKRSDSCSAPCWRRSAPPPSQMARTRRERSRRGRRPLERLPGRDTHHAGNAVRSQVSRRIGHGFEPGRRRRLRRRRRDEDDARDARLDYTAPRGERDARRMTRATLHRIGMTIRIPPTATIRIQRSVGETTCGGDPRLARPEWPPSSPRHCREHGRVVAERLALVPLRHALREHPTPRESLPPPQSLPLSSTASSSFVASVAAAARSLRWST